MSSLPASSLHTLPPNNDSGDDSSSERQGLLSQSAPKRDYRSTSLESSGSLVPPIIGDDEVEVEGGGYLRRSRSSLDRRRAQTAASALQGGRKNRSNEQLQASGEEDWFHIANEERRKDHLTSDLQTFIHMLKGNVGTGLLAMPLAVKNAGYILGPIGFLVLGVVATHCMLLLVKCSQHLSKKHGVDSLNYAEVMKFAILERFSKPLLGTVGLCVVNIFLTVTQFGFCAVYFVFIGDSMSRVAKDAFDFHLTTQHAIAIILPLIIVCCWIRELEGLTVFSLIANLCLVFSLAAILYEMLYQLSYGEGDEEAAVRRGKLHAFNIAHFPLYFGSAVYAFEGIGVVLPLENKMKKPHHFKAILIISMVVVVTIYILFGLLGYLTYGSAICPSITLNLVGTNTAARIVFIIAVLFYAYVIFASFMLQFYVPMDFLEIPFFKLIRLEHRIDYLRYSRPRLHGPVKWTLHTVFRTVVVLLTATLAFNIPDLEGLITLIGAVASSALAFIFPPLLQILTFWDDKPAFLSLSLDANVHLTIPWWITVAKCVVIFLLGVVGSITGTIFSIVSIVHYFETNKHPCS